MTPPPAGLDARPGAQQEKAGVMSRIERLSPHQEELLMGKRDEWIAHGLRTQPADRAAAEAGVRMAYQAADLVPPRFIIWLDSPLAGVYGKALVPLAAQKAQVGDQVRVQVGDLVWAQAWDQVWAQVSAQVWDQVWAQVSAQVSDQVGAQVGAQVSDQVSDQVWDQVGAQVSAQVGDLVGDQVWDQVGAQVWAQVGDQVGDQVWDQVGAQVWAQVGDQVWDQVGAQVGALVGDQVSDQVSDQVRAQVRDQVSAQVGAQVGALVGDQVRDQVRAQVWDQVRDQVRAQVGDLVWAQVSDHVWDQFRDQVGGWWIGLIGSWAIHWSAWADTFEHLGVTGPEGFHGIQQVAANAGWWWSYKDFAVITERPTSLTRDPQNRLHNPSGPAILYPDGFAVYAWHGTRIPADLIEIGWDIARTLREENLEIRRCAVEIMADRGGWKSIIDSAGWAQVGGSVPDPANPGQSLALWHVPAVSQTGEGVGLYEQPVRLLQCTNATVERDGTRHEFGITVPVEIESPIAAAAWTFNLAAEQYAEIQRAC